MTLISFNPTSFKANALPFCAIHRLLSANELHENPFNQKKANNGEMDDLKWYLSRKSRGKSEELITKAEAANHGRWRVWRYRRMGIGATLQRLGEVDFGLRLGAVEDGEDMTRILGLELPKGFRCLVFFFFFDERCWVSRGF